jgi:hypothetical protein
MLAPDGLGASLDSVHGVLMERADRWTAAPDEKSIMFDFTAKVEDGISFVIQRQGCLARAGLKNMKTKQSSNAVVKLWYRIIGWRRRHHDPFLSVSITHFNFPAAGIACCRSNNSF